MNGLLHSLHFETTSLLQISGRMLSRFGRGKRPGLGFLECGDFRAVAAADGSAAAAVWDAARLTAGAASGRELGIRMAVIFVVFSFTALSSLLTGTSSPPVSVESEADSDLLSNGVLAENPAADGSTLNSEGRRFLFLTEPRGRPTRRLLRLAISSIVCWQTGSCIEGVGALWLSRSGDV